MTDEEKIAWFDEAIENMAANTPTADEAIKYVEDCGDAAYDLYFDFVEQFRKIKG